MHRCGVLLVITMLLAASQQPVAQTQIKAQARTAPVPAWNKGILPISSESYWNAVECGKRGGQDPPCVFYDTGLCKNEDFTLALFTPYKMVAYEVWRAVQAKQPAPTPSYVQAQQTRITVGVTQVRNSKNAFADLVVKRAGKPVAPVAKSAAGTEARFTYDYPAFAATVDITLDLVGKTRTISCLIDRSVLTQFR